MKAKSPKEEEEEYKQLSEDLRKLREQNRKAGSGKPNSTPLAVRLNDWLMVTFSGRKLSYVYFYFTEAGVDLRNPVQKMEPYIAYVHPKANMKQVTPLFETKIKKGRNIKLRRIEIIPVGRIAVI